MARITLRNVRLSFPHIWKKHQYDADSKPKYEATLLIPKSDEEQIQTIRDHIEEKLIEKFETKAKIPKVVYSDGKSCFKDGDLVDYDGYADHMSFKASGDMQPSILQINKSPATEDMNLFYAGCYVDVSVEVWIQNNKYGKRVNANLFAIRYRGEGEAFSSGRIPQGVEDDFEDIDTEDDDLNEADI